MFISEEDVMMIAHLEDADLLACDLRNSFDLSVLLLMIVVLSNAVLMLYMALGQFKNYVFYIKFI